MTTPLVGGLDSVVARSCRPADLIFPASLMTVRSLPLPLRIPPGAEVEYTLELVALPGKEEDIVEQRSGDSFTGNAFDDQ